jgi:DNA anti-recombination protein RmuC
MNASSLDELRNAAVSRESKDERMEQVRQLLFGDHEREVSTRFMLLESRLRDLEMHTARQLEDIGQRIDRLASESDASRRGAFDELSRSVHELGERIAAAARR